MPFNKKINGFQNESEFVTYLNNRKVNKLNPLFQDLITTLYSNLTGEEIISCKLNSNLQKADIYITINNITKGVSIKKGVKNSVHIEPINDFIKFLKSNQLKEDVIEEILKYHYGDGTTNGTGKKRISSEEYKKFHQDKLDNINKYFNQENIIKAAVNRFVLIGNNNNVSIDALIYGVIDDFIWITKEEITKIVLSNKNIKKTGLAFGSLFYQPMNRCLNYNPKYEYSRNYIQIKWYHLSDDIIEIMAMRNNHLANDNET